MAATTKKYEVILIEEGLGNLGTCFYYTRDSLVYAAENKVFEGKKCYANHPDAIEAKTRPERSVKDVIGYFEKVRVEDGPAGQALLCGTLVLPLTQNLDWARVLVETSIDVSGKFDSELLGLSINATGVSEEITLEKFMAEASIPVSALPKLIEAKNEGIENIEVCNKITEAVSCDMVTEAGAKGRFKQVLESERKNMAKKISKKDQDAKKKALEAEYEKKLKALEADDAEGSDDDSDHDDADKDKELIKSMLKQYVGGDDHSDEECQAMKQALDHAKEMGMEGEEAEKCAGYTMKMAKHVAQKKEAADKAAAEAGDKPANGAGQPSGGATDTPAGDPGKPGSKKESAAIAELSGRLAKMEAENEAMKLAAHIEKTISESKLPASAQKKFRECLGKPKTTTEVTEKLKVFKEAFGARPAEEGFTNPERTEAADGGKSFSLADCVETE